MNQSDRSEVQNHLKASDGWKMQKPGEPLGLFLLRNTRPDGECLIWTGSISGGYGRVSLKGKTYLVHRKAYEAFKGNIPEGLHLDHLCRNRGCINPLHLEAVTQQENTKRATATRTHCVRGHALEGGNLYERRNYRCCLTCKREDQRAYAKRARSAAAG